MLSFYLKTYRNVTLLRQPVYLHYNYLEISLYYTFDKILKQLYYRQM